MGSRSSMGRGKGWPIVKYSDTVVICAKGLNRSRCCLVLVHLGGPKEACIRWHLDPSCEGQLLGEGHALACPTTLCRELCKNG